MNQLETLKASGALRIVVTSAEGQVKEDVQVKNLVVNTGLNYIVSRMKDATATAMSHMELGTGTTAAAGADTALGTAISGSRTALTSTTVSGNTVTYVASFSAGTGTGAVTEAGIFNATSAGTMLCRTVFPVVNKQSGDSMTVTWTVTVS
ncbi:hypothetical protein UFOVP236_41 [uncultured Caudovirales phage]|uniref:Uncharacterized protein n=1 Tax=uncultured Caudovirales phage TaxID=2100421 RepID=A0A6J7WR40_9CAUD|nr:hypothetical protein UFOVP236_41 [uncultured Caudovirales phage]